MAASTAEGESLTSSLTGRSVFSAEAMLSAPQIPQPVRPVRRRDRAAITSSHAADTVA